MSQVSLSLLVLKTRQLEKLRSFYSALGVEFLEEKHGNGPVHFAATVRGIVLEIYPLADGEHADSTIRLGFVVNGLDAVIATLWQNGLCEVSQPKHSAWGYRAVVHDPDGRSVELYQEQSSS